MEAWELLELKGDECLVKEITSSYLRDNGFTKIPDVNCRVCPKKNLGISDMINVNDDFYVCKSCLDNKWQEILDILFKSEK